MAMPPLEGLRVLDFSHLMPGPWCAQTLGDLGADVVKVERKGVPDPSRFNAPHYRVESVYFHSVNRNKRSIALDLNDAADRATASELVARADVLIESFRPGVAQRLAIDYETVAAANPRIIYCSVTGFGAQRALASTPGHDAALQGLAGILGVPGLDVPPMPQIQTADWAAAAFATIGILAAHAKRQATGQGARIDASMYDALLSWSSIKLSSALARLAGHSGLPALESFGTNPRYATYRSRDGKAVTVSLLEARSWALFCDHIGRPDLVYEESASDRHTSHPGRTEHFREAIAAFCLAHDRDDLVARMEAAGIAIGPVYSPDEAVDAAHRFGAIAFYDHPVDGRVPYFVDPLARSGLADPLRRPAPAPDEHGQEIRAELASPTGAWGRAPNER
jgi:crotonobetainyl-CoA:carnitine CoA-transferase CaiB-like acyl-CoA transferase